MTFDEMVAAIAEVKARTDRPFGVNLRTDAVDIERRVDHLIDQQVSGSRALPKHLGPTW